MVKWVRGCSWCVSSWWRTSAVAGLAPYSSVEVRATVVRTPILLSDMGSPKVVERCNEQGTVTPEDAAAGGVRSPELLRT
jgi:hypothetical protein